MIGVGCKGEAGRPPGALTDPVRPEKLSIARLPGPLGRCEATATLNRRKMIADDFLNPSDAVAERLDILFGWSRQNLHQRAAADFARRVGGKRRQLANARVSATPCAPSRRGSKIKRMRQSLRKVRSMRRLAESRCSALCQRRPPGRRAQTSATPTPERAPRSSRRASSRASSGNPANRRNAAAIASASWVRTKSGVSGNRLRDDELFPVSRPRLSAMRRANGRPARAPRPKLQAWRFAKLNAGLECVDGEANRSEPCDQDPRRDQENPDAVAPPS